MGMNVRYNYGYINVYELEQLQHITLRNLPNRMKLWENNAKIVRDRCSLDNILENFSKYQILRSYLIFKL